MSIHEHLPPQARKEVGWAKGLELAKLARRDREHFDCATWLHRAREMPKEQFKQTPAVTSHSAACVNQQQHELPHLVTLVVRTVHSGPAEPLFPALCCIYRGDEQSQRRTLLWPRGKKQWNMTPITKKPIPKLHVAPQPPLSYPGATPDADRAKRPPLGQPWRWSGAAGAPRPTDAVSTHRFVS